MSPELLACSILGLIAVVVGHELTHVLIARAHGHETVCVAINPVGVAVVFEDTPSRRYWTWQVVLPMVVTAAMSYVWLVLLVGLSSSLQPAFTNRVSSELLPLIAVFLAVLTSGGDILGVVVELRRPVWGDERIIRDLRILRRVRSVVRFTEYGRRRWEPSWKQIATLPARRPAAPALPAE